MPGVLESHNGKTDGYKGIVFVADYDFITSYKLWGYYWTFWQRKETLKEK